MKISLKKYTFISFALFFVSAAYAMESSDISNKNQTAQQLFEKLNKEKGKNISDAKLKMLLKAIDENDPFQYNQALACLIIYEKDGSCPLKDFFDKYPQKTIHKEFSFNHMLWATEVAWRLVMGNSEKNQIAFDKNSSFAPLYSYLQQDREAVQSFVTHWSDFVSDPVENRKHFGKFLYQNVTNKNNSAYSALVAQMQQNHKAFVCDNDLRKSQLFSILKQTLIAHISKTEKQRKEAFNCPKTVKLRNLAHQINLYQQGPTPAELKWEDLGAKKQEYNNILETYDTLVRSAHAFQKKLLNLASDQFLKIDTPSNQYTQISTLPSQLAAIKSANYPNLSQSNPGFSLSSMSSSLDLNSSGCQTPHDSFKNKSKEDID